MSKNNFDIQKTNGSIIIQNHTDEIIENYKDKSIETILNKEQLSCLRTEYQIRECNLNQEGKICGISGQISEEKVKQRKKKEGVIDASIFEGSIIIIFNSNEKIPEGIRDFKNIKGHTGLGRAGEYDPEEDICFVDISNTYSYLNERYQADWETPTLRHELRHALVNHIDTNYFKNTGQISRRNGDFDLMNKEDLMQLSYLDELHSVYFDVLEGKKQESLTDINANFYSTSKQGTHLEVASGTKNGKDSAKKLFNLLQRLLLSKKIFKNNSNTILVEKIDKATVAAGIILATERSLSDALKKIEEIIDMLMFDTEIKNRIEK